MENLRIPRWSEEKRAIPNDSEVYAGHVYASPDVKEPRSLGEMLVAGRARNS
ncbi:hypothetical protein A2U01_0098124 [Trifolium medium]|nr:hypothetical protein [Trifolium medium]